MPNNKIAEESRLRQIVKAINDETVNGVTIKSAFADAFGRDIERAFIENGGGRGTHFDFLVKLRGEPDFKKVEVKSSKTYKKIPNGSPWQLGVQFGNIGGNKLTIGNKYAVHFYNNILPVIARTYDATHMTPTYDEWKKEAFRQNKSTSRTSPFVHALRVRGGGTKYLRDMRTRSFREFVVSDDDKNDLIEEVRGFVADAVNEKDYWLQTTGDVENGPMRCRWDAVLSEAFAIDDVEIVNNTLDFVVNFTKDGHKKFSGILRWGYGICLNNVRFDLK